MDAEERRLRRVRRALGNPVFFGNYYMRPYDPAWRDGGPLPPFADDLLRFVHGVERGVVIIGPEHLKTTLGTQLYGLWRTVRAAYFGEQLRGMLMSEEQGMSAANLGVIAWHIEHNEHLLADFADDAGRPLVRPSAAEDVWRDDAIVIERPHPSKDPTWQAKGIDGKGIHGRRLDLFLGDDLVTPANAHSPALRQQALRTFDHSIRSRLVADAKAVILGNFNDTRDLLSTLARRPRWDQFRRASMHLPGDATTPADDQDLTNPDRAVPLWPQVWPRDRHLAEYQEAPNAYRRLHLLDEKAERGEMLQVEWLRQVAPDDVPVSECRIFLAVDPAPGGVTDDLDFVNVTIGAEMPGQLTILGSMDFRAKLPEQIDRLGAFYDRFKRVGRGVFAIGVRRIALDTYFHDAIVMKRPDLVPYIVPISLPEGTKQQQLQRLGPKAQSGYLRILIEAATALTSDGDDQKDEISFIEQWRGFPAIRHDDKLDGALLVCEAAEEFVDVRDEEIELVAQ